MNNIEKLLVELLSAIEYQDAHSSSEIEQAEKDIAKANNKILDEKAAIELRRVQKETFHRLIDAINSKHESDTEALAMLYISDKTDEDIEEFCDATGIGNPTKSTPEKEEEKDGIEAVG